eukprot:CAMPEP_0172548320 /NCGR_PEP_ID=MMETSP1067-20121228/17636_1 /TAXON_ID=265564 ORGANISM="Thalassiosira punctigera, Strain Tpunct2005C2" /NCGR_SAMPLE_ID=MMETSP1067 /ASSEMBLY_ACC=CAM_ASM_000444 /LENGTH=414 /DNA_ID=CAMNT_0013335521 /DNA_START=107 /DNA_END=1351 /DNA_ORIENTATION=-
MAVLLHHLSLVLCLVGVVTVDASSPAFAINSLVARAARKRYRATGPLRAAAGPRIGLAQRLLDVALASPVWTYVLVPRARATMVETAEENGIPWMAAKEWLRGREDAPWNEGRGGGDRESLRYPEYYERPFHAYSEGNLSYEAAFEQELASRAVGARNFPKYSERGEDVFRGAFDRALAKLGARVNRGGDDGREETVVVDFGCGTGASTRRLAAQFPEADRIVGIDLSPYFVDVGRTLLRLAPSAIEVSDDDDDAPPNGWITAIDPDPRIELRQGDIANTGLPSDSVDVVNLVFVLHELPVAAAKEVILEAHRILRPGGQLWIGEMDFESPAYAAQRENALLFSLLRATEPYLDEYADGMPGLRLRDFVADVFDGVRVAAATGRHYIEDSRFREDRSYAIKDTHLKPWESKRDA